MRTMLLSAIAIMIGPSLAYGSPACMTQSEARAKFPKAHLFYMHGSEHCWTSNAASVPAAVVHSPRGPLAAAPEHSPLHSVPAAAPAPSAPPALAAAPLPSPRPEIINAGIDAGAQCRYSPCE